MLVLHGGYRKGFFIWGERSFTRNSLHDLRRMRRIGGDLVVDHLWASGGELLASTLSELGFENADVLTGEKKELFLPTYAEKYPIPSTLLLGEIPKSHIKRPMNFTIRSWYVETLSLRAADLVGLRQIFQPSEETSSDGRFLTSGVIASLDLCYIMECCEFAISLLERGRFLPDIRVSPGGEKYESMWNPVLIGDDSTRFARLARCMPAVLRAGMDSPEFSPSSVLRDIFSDLVNGLVKHAWARKFGEQKPVRSPRGIAKAIVQNVLYPDAARPEKKRRGKLVNSLNPHALWIRSLGWYGEIEGLNQSLESIYPDVREWRSRYEWFEHAPFKLSVKLSGGEENSHWRLDYFLRYLNSGDVIPAGNVWRGVMPVPRETGDYMRRYLLLMLGRVGALFAPVRESLELAAPGGCVLSTEDVSGFLLNHAPEMAGMGVELAYPDWWEKNSSDMLTIRGAPGVNDSSYKWELAWRGAILSGDERLAVAGGGLPLVWIRGGWVFISPDRLSAVLRHMEKLPDSLSRVEVIRLAIRDPLIDGFEGLPELEAEYSALRRGVPPEMIESPAGANVNLRSYQQRGFSWLAFLSGLGIGACLADDMGLGKTVQTLALVQRCRNLGQNRPVLLICPTSVIENWRIEIERFFPRMSFYVHHGRDRLRGRAFSGAAKRSAMVLSSYALLHRDFECYKGVDWLGLVLDEAQNIKNPDAQQSRAARGMKSDWRIVLTGTPIENHVGDIWSIMEFLMPGMLGSRRYFANTYIKPLKEAPDARVTEGLRRSISPFIMRRLKTDKDIVPDLPKKIEMKVYCGLKKEQFKLYAGVTNEMSRDIGRAAGIRRRGLVLAGLTRIKQICDHPSLALKDCDFGCHRSSKLERLMALAEEMFEAGDRALIFTQYVEMGHILKYQLQERFGRETLFLHGAVFKDARDRMVRNFQEGTGPQFFVLSLKAGGVGLNLTRANHVVMFDRWWNPAVENQAIDRAYRIGQTNKVQVHIFCCRGTLEERIDEVISSKRALADSVILENDSWITELSDRELRDLISLSPRVIDP